MEIPENRRWMYQRLDANKRWKDEFREGVYEFMQFVTSQDMFRIQGEQTRCPCRKCKCKVFKFVDDVMRDLYEEGFMPKYYWWSNHGEELPQFPPVVLQGSYNGSGGQREDSNEFKRPPTAWEVKEKTKKLKSGEWVNDKSRDLAEKGTSTQGSSNTSVSVNDNKIYLTAAGGANYKGNVYELGILSKGFSYSKSASSSSVPPVVDQIKDMRETISKLNAEFLAKAEKERTLEEKVLKLMEQMQEQNEQIRQQNEQIQRILQHLHIQSIVSGPSLLATTTDGTEPHVDDVDDARVDHVHDTLENN